MFEGRGHVRGMLQDFESVSAMFQPSSACQACSYHILSSKTGSFTPRYLNPLVIVFKCNEKPAFAVKSVHFWPNRAVLLAGGGAGGMPGPARSSNLSCISVQIAGLSCPFVDVKPPSPHTHDPVVIN